MKKKIVFGLLNFITFLLFAINANATTVTISDMPAYNWYHGCGPTAAASIIGHYDLNGYDALFTASGWDNVRLTSKVKDEISSPEHNAKYDPDPDNSSLPDPADTSIADFFHTSENLGYGWSYLSYADDAFTGYADYRGYNDWNAWNESFDTGDFSWADFTNEIDNDRPMMFLVDTNADGATDHFIPVFGYNDSTLQYACYTTWSEDETISWYDFQGMGNAWGIGYATFITPGASDAPVPEPATLLLFGIGLLGFAGVSRKKAA